MKNGFFFKTEGEDDSPRLTFDELSHMYMRVHNLAVKRLQEAEILDDYCRLCCTPRNGIIQLKAFYAEDDAHYESLPSSYASLLAADIVYNRFGRDNEDHAWIQCYPSKFAEMACVDIENAILKHDRTRLTYFTEGFAYDLDFVIPVNEWASGHHIDEFALFENVVQHRNQMEFTMRNQFGNKMVMTVLSNTSKVDFLFDRMAMDRVFSHLDNGLTICISETYQSRKANKLLLRVTYHTNGKEVSENDSPHDGKELPEEV